MDNLIKDEKGLVKTGNGTAVNPNYLSASGLQQAQQFSGIPSTITSSSLSSNPTPLNLPTPTPPTTTASGISAAKESSITNAKATYDQQLQDYNAEKKSTAESSKSSVLSYLGLGDQALQDKIDATQTPEFKAKKEVLTKANNDIIASRKAQDAEIKALESTPGTLEQKSQRINDINSKYAFNNAQLSLTANMALNDYTAAKQDINDLYTLKMEAYQPYIKYYSDLAQNDQKLFNDSELEIIKGYKDSYTKAQTDETQRIKDNGDAMIKYNSLGAGITVNDTPEQRAQKIASVGGDLGYEQRLQSIKTASTTGKLTTPEASASIDNDVKAILEGRNTAFNIRQTMGRTNAAAAYMQSLRDKITAIDPNFDFVASDAGGKSVSTSYVQRATASINAVLPNIDKIVDLSNQVGRIGVKGVDALLQKGNIQINNQKVSNFHEAQKLIADEIGVALGAGTVSDMKLQLGFDVTDPSVSPEVFASNMDIVKEFIQNRKAGLDSLRYSSSTTNGFSAGNSPLKTASSYEDYLKAIQ